MFNVPDELKEALLEPCKRLINAMENERHKFTFEEMMELEKLKFSVHMYELERDYKQGRLTKWNF